MTLPLSAQIESLLLYEGSALSAQDMAKTLGVKKDEIVEALAALHQSLAERGIVLIENGTSYMLATHPDMQPVFEKLRKQELERELSKAALETLTVIAYRSPITKAQIDYIRGVNSHFSLRNLLVRGLIEKSDDTKEETRYMLSTDTLSYMGITGTHDLPDYQHVQDEFVKILARESSESGAGK